MWTNIVLLVYFITFDQYSIIMNKDFKNTLSIGERLRKMRESASLSLRDISQVIGVDASLLGKIERNERQPTKAQLKYFADFFNIDEKILIKELLSDQIAYRLFEEDVDIGTLKVAEEKLEYIKNHNNK